MRARVGETLMEIVVAMTLFGIIMTGVFEFMGNQAQAISMRHERRILMQGVHKYVNRGSWVDSEDKALGVKFKYDDTDNGGCISVVENKNNGKTLLSIYLDPPSES